MSVVNQMYNDSAGGERRKEEDFQENRCRLSGEEEYLGNQQRLAREYSEKQKEAAKSAAKAARQQMEEQTSKKRKERLSKERDDGEWVRMEEEKRNDTERRRREQVARSPPPKQNLPRLTAENLRATAGSDDFVDGNATSSLNRPFGDMTRTFLEGMVPADEAEKEETRKMEKRLRNTGRRVRCMELG